VYAVRRANGAVFDKDICVDGDNMLEQLDGSFDLAVIYAGSG